MKSKDEDFPVIAEVIRENLKRWREARGWSQEDLAAAARAVGLKWGRPRVTAIESGREALSLDEGLMIQGVLGIPLRDLVDPGPSLATRKVKIDEAIVPRQTLLDLARGEPRKLPLARKRIEIGLSDPILRRLSQLATTYDVPPDIRLLMGSYGDAEKKAARRLRDLGLETDRLEVSVASVKLWGHDLTQERDQRARARGDGNPAQGVRGHITRELLEELIECIRVHAPQTNL